MILQGLPDFQQPVQGDGLQIFYPFEGRGNFVLIPDRLAIAERKDGRPDFMLELVRGKDLYGVLDFRLRPRYRIDEALALLRLTHPDAMLDGAIFSSGFLRFQQVGDADAIPPDLVKPIPLAWNGLGVGRFVFKVSRDTALMLKGALQDATLTLGAVAEVEMLGVSPRLPARVRFDPARLLGALAALCDKEGGAAQAEIVDFFRRDWQTLPIAVLGDMAGLRRDDFAEAMTDRIRARFGTFVPSPHETVTPYFALAAPEAVGSGQFEWDLAAPVTALRTLVLVLHPLEAAREMVKAQGLESVFREITAPPLPTGTFPVTVRANLHPERPNIVSLGVKLRVPPHPPQRFQAVTASAELQPPEDTASVTLRLSPVEKPEYTYSTFAVLQSAQGIEQLEGKAIPHAGEQLNLSLEDFPIDFIPIEAAPALLEIASMHGICRWMAANSQVEQAFDLDPGRPAVALALPKGTAGATLEIEARARDVAKTLKLGPLPATSLRLDLFSFPEYGPHHIEIECVFGDGQGLFALELLPEGRPEVREEITILGFTREQPKRAWSWLADSPFRAGYRYRPRRSPGETPAAWSEVRSPFAPLTINAVTGGVQ